MICDSRREARRKSPSRGTGQGKVVEVSISDPSLYRMICKERVNKEPRISLLAAYLVGAPAAVQIERLRRFGITELPGTFRDGPLWRWTEGIDGR